MKSIRSLAWLWLLLVVGLGGLLVGGMIVLLRGNQASAQEGAALVAGAFGLVGVTMAGVQNYLSYLERRDQVVRDLVFRELGRFKGGIQERNIGISVIGSYWSSLPDLQGMFVRVLTNQGIYIAVEGQLDKPHEYSNMTRIVELLESVRDEREYNPFLKEMVEELSTKSKQVPSKAQAPAGTRATREVFDQWIKRLTPAP